jgi:predicted  nucleic acid-binding Zn-ribbon protein
MSPDLERLIKLQHLETQIAEGKQAIAAHPQRVAAIDARLNEARGRVEAAKQRLAASQEARRALEKEVAVYQGRLSKYRDQQSAVKTNREYQALGHEIETAQQELGNVEEKVIERMVEADTVTDDVKRAEAQLAVDQKEIDAAKKELEAERQTTERQLQQATEARAAIVKELDPRLLSLFETVARARKGVAVSMATRDGLCSICHVRLRPPVFQHVRANNDIVQCESCQRILYYVPPPPPIEQARVHTS